MIRLESDRLRIGIAGPGERPNTGFRFDRAGFVSEVVLDGAVHFCANEPSNLAHPSTGGRGLCSEFTADYSSLVKEGEYYPKFGVGLIRKDGPYCFYARYGDVKEFPVTVRSGKTWAEFVTETLPCLGYAMRSVRQVSVEGATLTMETEAVNLGEREIVTGEYCHNFLSLDGMAVSPDYRLELPGILGLSGKEIKNQYPTPCNFSAEPWGIGFLRVELPVSLSSIPLDGLRDEMPFSWQLSHEGAGAWVRGEDWIRPSALTLWAADHIVSPEIIQTVRICPGETVSWKRSWTFGMEK